MYSSYYQANISRRKAWFLSGFLRNESNVVFARALPGNSSVFEFFVSEDLEDVFLSLMEFLKRKNYVLTYTKKQNPFARTT